MTTKKLALISEMKDVVIKLMERDLTFEQKKVYKEIYKDITNNNADYYDLKELKNKHKELVNLLKWSKLNAYPILTKEGREFNWQDDLLSESNYHGQGYGLYVATTKKGFKFPIYRVNYYTIIIPVNEGTICGYPADGYKFCSFVSRTDVIENVEFVKSDRDIEEEGLTYIGLFGDAIYKYNYNSFYHCSPVMPTMITL
jgi:hypothetical protein